MKFKKFVPAILAILAIAMAGGAGATWIF